MHLGTALPDVLVWLLFMLKEGIEPAGAVRINAVLSLQVLNVSGKQYLSLPSSFSSFMSILSLFASARSPFHVSLLSDMLTWWGSAWWSKPNPLSFELSQGSRLLLIADLTLAGMSLTIARRFPLGGLPGRLSRTWGRTPTVGIVHKVIFNSPDLELPPFSALPFFFCESVFFFASLEALEGFFSDWWDFDGRLGAIIVNCFTWILPFNNKKYKIHYLSQH
jgi:hypothetical protein